MISTAFAAAFLALGFGCAHHPPQTSGDDWHTTPDRWAEPRLFQTPMDSEFAEHITISRDRSAPKPSAQVFSPNDAYYFWKLTAHGTNSLDHTMWLYIFTERPYVLKVQMKEYDLRYDNDSAARWINEKLLFVRVWWGRVLGTDLLIDVEKEKIVYEEMIEDGSIPFQQWHDPTRSME